MGPKNEDANTATVEDLIREAILTSQSELNLERKDLRELPSDLARCSQLRILRLGGNYLSELDARLLVGLENLEVLDLSVNEIAQFPSSLSRLPRLRHLNLNRNHIEGLLRFPSGLTNLEELDLCANGVERVESSLSRLSGLKRLALRSNLLRQLPAELGRLTKLQELDLGDNYKCLPPPEIRNLKALHTLSLTGNALEELPAYFGGLNEGVSLLLDDNPWAEPLPELIKRGALDLLEYLRSLDDALENYEGKLLLVGEGNVGKTTLVKTLQGEAFVEGRATTHGIEISALDLQHPELPEVSIRLRAWDFGGQEVYRITHQFFFSPRAVYLLVWRPREGQEENAVAAWIQRILLRIRREAKLVIVASHAEERQPELDLPALRRLAGPMLSAAVAVDSRTGLGIPELRLLLSSQAAALPQMGERLSSRWVSAREDLLARPDFQVARAEFDAVCAFHRLPVEAVDTFAKLLNDVGYIVYFPEDEGLRDIVVLQPEWLTKAIGLVLEDSGTRAADGVLAHGRLRSIWSRDEYPTSLHPYFLRLMEKFDVSYRIPDTDSSLVAQLVPLDEPDGAVEDFWALSESGVPSLCLICQLSEPAPGLMAWLTVRTHRFSKGQHWRSGVLLQHDRSDSRAFFRMVEPQRLILDVVGAAPNLFFQVLRDTLEYLCQSRWQGLKYALLTACPTRTPEGRCSGTFTIKSLERYSSRGHREILCHECLEEHSIAALATGFGLSASSVSEQLSEILTLAKQTKLALSDQAASVRTVVRAIGEEVTDCPRLFTLTPKDRLTWTPKAFATRAYQLQLWCEEPAAQHPVGSSYDFFVPRDWLEQVGPYLRLLTKTLQLAAPAAGALMGLPGGLEDSGEKHFQFIKTFADIMEPAGNSVDGAPSGLTNAEGAGLRAYRHQLLALDPQRVFAGLRRVLSPTGDYLWLCSSHYPSYDPGLPKLDA